jgi:hypothetical protein
LPSSMIFVGLVVMWLIVLVPAVARHRQEVARVSTAALSGRVLERPRRGAVREPAGGGGVDVIDDAIDTGPAVRSDDGALDERAWERPPPRYRPGRGGYDPEAAALAARARYAFRQRVVLALLVTAVVSAVVAALAVPGAWWLHGGADLALVAYLVYLRRQVRLEQAIRDRRAARMAGTRRTSAADDPDLDAWARRGREVAAARPVPDEDEHAEPDGLDEHDQLAEEPERVSGTGEPVPVSVGVDGAPALPRLPPAPELALLDEPGRADHRSAVG